MKATNPDFHGAEAESLASGSEEDWSDDGEDVEADDQDDSELEGGMSFAEDSDAEDLRDLDEDLPEGLIEYESDEDAEPEGEEWEGFDADARKRKAGTQKEVDSRKKKRLRSLPTFASYEDYAKMIEDSPDNDV